MTEWLKEAFACYQFHIPYVLGEGKIVWIFLAALVLLFLWRKKTEAHRRFSHFYLVFLILLVNPFFVPAINSATAGDYWRALCFLSMPAVIAFAFVEVVFFLPKKAARSVAAVALVLSIFFVGVWQYNGVNFTRAENLYKIPQNVIEIADLVHENVEEPKLISDDEINYWIRQYDATIVSESARFEVGNKKIHEIMNSGEVYDLEKLYQKAVKRKCNCVVLCTDRLPEKVPAEYALLGETSSQGYRIYALSE